MSNNNCFFLDITLLPVWTTLNQLHTTTKMNNFNDITTTLSAPKDKKMNDNNVNKSNTGEQTLLDTFESIMDDLQSKQGDFLDRLDKLIRESSFVHSKILNVNNYLQSIANKQYVETKFDDFDYQVAAFLPFSIGTTVAQSESSLEPQNIDAQVEKIVPEEPKKQQESRPSTPLQYPQPCSPVLPSIINKQKPSSVVPDQEVNKDRIATILKRYALYDEDDDEDEEEWVVIIQIETRE